MRTLLIDNHDSFTYNLYQYLSACNAQPPLVIRNDELDWDEVEQLAFDNIVISPGPGRPQRHSDLGLSADALHRSRVPVLGVCLGHQAIAHHCGATVGLAAVPMHGRIDRISHVPCDLFRGIPERFDAVRYHSLAVTDLPVELEPLAWSSDGTLMGLRHTSKPWWGVQFHPESICSEYGARLLRNFKDLTLAWRAGVSPGSTPRCVSPVERGPALRIHAVCVDAQPDPEAIFAAVFAHAETTFWLDSSLAHPQAGRFSFMGDASGPHARLLTYQAAAKTLAIRQGQTWETRAQSIFDYLREQTPPRGPDTVSLPFDFTGGFVGYFGYELKSELGGQRRHDAATPDAAWILADRFLAFDHAQAQTWIVCLDVECLCAINEQWMQTMAQWLQRPLAAPPLDGALAAQSLASMQWRTELREYREQILLAQHEIRQGETYEVCLTNQLIGRGLVDAFAVYRALRVRNPAPYAAFLRVGGLAVLCASPELFLRVGTDCVVDAKPIKGTAARGRNAADDARIVSALRADEKNRSENLMIVDLLRNDLNRVCDVDSVHVPLLFDVETYASVHQLVSTVRGRLRPGLSAIDCVRAAFPGGSMTGAPKMRTMEIIDRLEPAARGVYSGSLGYLSFNGAAALNIVIRTIVCLDDHVSIGSGGAIIALSDPDAELQEIILKARASWETLKTCGAPLGDMPAMPPCAPKA